MEVVENDIINFFRNCISERELKLRVIFDDNDYFPDQAEYQRFSVAYNFLAEQMISYYPIDSNDISDEESLEKIKAAIDNNLLILIAKLYIFHITANDTQIYQDLLNLAQIDFDFGPENNAFTEILDNALNSPSNGKRKSPPKEEEKEESQAQPTPSKKAKSIAAAHKLIEKAAILLTSSSASSSSDQPEMENGMQSSVSIDISKRLNDLIAKKIAIQRRKLQRNKSSDDKSLEKLKKWTYNIKSLYPEIVESEKIWDKIKDEIHANLNLIIRNIFPLARYNSYTEDDFVTELNFEMSIQLNLAGSSESRAAIIAKFNTDFSASSSSSSAVSSVPLQIAKKGTKRKATKSPEEIKEQEAERKARAAQKEAEKKEFEQKLLEAVEKAARLDNARNTREAKEEEQKAIAKAVAEAVKEETRKKVAALAKQRVELLAEMGKQIEELEAVIEKQREELETAVKIAEQKTGSEAVAEMAKQKVELEEKRVRQEKANKELKVTEETVREGAKKISADLAGQKAELAMQRAENARKRLELKAATEKLAEERAELKTERTRQESVEEKIEIAMQRIANQKEKSTEAVEIIKQKAEEAKAEIVRQKAALKVEAEKAAAEREELDAKEKQLKEREAKLKEAIEGAKQEAKLAAERLEEKRAAAKAEIAEQRAAADSAITKQKTELEAAMAEQRAATVAEEAIEKTKREAEKAAAELAKQEAEDKAARMARQATELAAETKRLNIELAAEKLKVIEKEAIISKLEEIIASSSNVNNPDGYHQTQPAKYISSNNYYIQQQVQNYPSSFDNNEMLGYNTSINNAELSIQSNHYHSAASEQQTQPASTTNNIANHIKELADNLMPSASDSRADERFNVYMYYVHDEYNQGVQAMIRLYPTQTNDKYLMQRIKEEVKLNLYRLRKKLQKANGIYRDPSDFLSATGARDEFDFTLADSLFSPDKLGSKTFPSVEFVDSFNNFVATITPYSSATSLQAASYSSSSSSSLAIGQQNTQAASATHANNPSAKSNFADSSFSKENQQKTKKIVQNSPTSENKNKDMVQAELAVIKSREELPEEVKAEHLKHVSLKTEEEVKYISIKFAKLDLSKGFEIFNKFLPIVNNLFEATTAAKAIAASVSEDPYEYIPERADIDLLGDYLPTYAGDITNRYESDCDLIATTH